MNTAVEINPLPADWPAIQRRILRRDRHMCQRCERKRRLSVHHIVPRGEEGDHRDANLITLCVPCHDYVEARPDLRSRAAIIGSGPLTDLVNVPVEEETEPQPQRIPAFAPMSERYPGYDAPAGRPEPPRRPVSGPLSGFMVQITSRSEPLDLTDALRRIVQERTEARARGERPRASAIIG